MDRAISMIYAVHPTFMNISLRNLRNLQEIDIPVDYDVSLLSFKGYNLLVENNEVKSRTGIYVTSLSNISY